MKGFFLASGTLIADAKTTIPVLVRLLNNAPEQVRNCVRLSNRLQTSFADFNDFTQKMAAQVFFLQDVFDEKYTLGYRKNAFI